MVGIIQEQHPDRCELFVQWKQMGWPIMVDSLNLLDVAAVPIALGIDEFGVVREGRLRPRGVESFLNTKYKKPPGYRRVRSRKPDLAKLKKAADKGGFSARRDYADALVNWGGPKRLGEAIAAYRATLDSRPDDGRTLFRLGVAHRKRYDSELREPDDFQNAVRNWQAALNTNPNQYIWRRRIQQYGPLLDKPYPFYNWVAQARQEIKARGETPAELVIEPGGTELAGKSGFNPSSAAAEEPDPQGRIDRDDAPLVIVETAVVPPVLKPGGTARVHVVMRPNSKAKGHWNNEAGEGVLWVNPPTGWQVSKPGLTIPNAGKDVSDEVRVLEFEIRCAAGTSPGSINLSAYALYYICEDVDGQCLYRRQDVPIRISVRE